MNNQNNNVINNYFKNEIKLLNGGFNKNNSYNNTSYLLKDTGINRWENLFFDPQKNSIEPFNRIGQNTVLQSLDEYSSKCNYK
tara:strand:+ start:868 stop:1116 length:249 start_codon:yes stop_codon:yes gene_type:complete